MARAKWPTFDLHAWSGWYRTRQVRTLIDVAQGAAGAPGYFSAIDFTWSPIWVSVLRNVGRGNLPLSE